MQITVAENAGFCFGVKRASESVEEKLAQRQDNEKIYTLGKLIHNDVYNKALESRGVGVVCAEELEKLCEEASANSPVTVFVRAHGIEKQTELLLTSLAKKNPSFKFVDCTCPYVKKIHKIVEKDYADESFLIVMGKHDHPEVRGIVSRFLGNFAVYSSPEELKFDLDNGALEEMHKKKPILVAQTTYDLVKWRKSQEIIKKVCTKALIFDTICSVTELRQQEANTISKECELVVVIGGRESSNTAKLFDICKRNCESTIWVEDVDELLKYIKIPFTHEKVGIVAGASTPSNLIEGVHKTMSEMENFEELLESSLKTLNTGDTVTGIVTAISSNEIQLDIGSNVTGRIEADQITDDPSVKLGDLFKVGDSIEAFVIRVSDIEGFATLSKKRVDSDRNWQKIVAAKENGDILEGKVIEAVRGGVVILTGANRVFVPASQTGIARDGDLSVLVGTSVSFKVIEIKDQGKKAIGSIKVVLNEEKNAAEAAFWAAIEEGKTYTGKVKSMTSYGAFVDLGGVDGMVHVTELSWKRLKSPAEVLSIGDEITVFVKSFDLEKKKISLGYKTEDTNRWFIFTSNYAVGDVASVKIVNMMPFGAFAEIVDGVDGLIHISQIANKRIAKPADVLEIGQVVDAKITEIDTEKQKVSLSIRALIEEAQAEEEAEVVAEYVAEEEAAAEEVAEEPAAEEATEA